MDLTSLKKLLMKQGCTKLYAKELSPNDNSKNQIYLSGSFEVLNIFPFNNVVADDSGDWNRSRFKTDLDFYWVTDSGQLAKAPNAKLILYPKYPEVRFSGFLFGCNEAPSKLLSQRLVGRILFLSVSAEGNILGRVAASESKLALEFSKQTIYENLNIFKVIPLKHSFASKHAKRRLLAELRRIHSLGWIRSKRLNKNGEAIDYRAANGGGYTLEAELGIIPNGYAMPDFLGWEIKQFGVSYFDKLQSSTITLMTPEPTGGIYKDKGAEYFIRKYGYKDKKGRPDRLNFGGVYRVGKVQPTTLLKLDVIGYDIDSMKIKSSLGRIVLLDQNDNEAAFWSFSSILQHWQRKHAKACYIPSIVKDDEYKAYHYGSRVLMGEETSFELCLKQMILGQVYYDPGIKMENLSKGGKIKKRSQFRIKSKQLGALYNHFYRMDLFSESYI